VMYKSIDKSEPLASPSMTAMRRAVHRFHWQVLADSASS
jgi:hypothetical protein